MQLGARRPSGDGQIDTPRVYRGGRLPHALPWSTVGAFLQSTDRSTPLGKRDYAIFQLMANYGLRSSEVVAVALDDIQWRMGRLRIHQRKTSSTLVFPLTDLVGESLAEYLRHGRPDTHYRQVFVRHRAPAGLLKPTAITEAFQAWSRRSGLAIPFQGAHCLRHSYAIHLLRQGTSVKTIGDLLGHRSTESTCDYLRLAVEDLREVALDLPCGQTAEVNSGGGFGQTMQTLFRATGIRTESGGLDPHSPQPLFRNHRGQGLSRYGARYILAKYCRRASISAPSLASKRLHPHSMRHSSAIHLLKAGVDLVTISHWLGHTSVNTSNRYTSIDLEAKREAISKIALPDDGGSAGPSWRTDPSILEWLESL